MSFLKITDPKKRDLIVEEYLKTKQNLKQSLIAERLGEQDTLDDLTKYFRPITDAQSEQTRSLVSEIQPIKEGIRDLPKAITFDEMREKMKTNRDLLVTLRQNI